PYRPRPVRRRRDATPRRLQAEEVAAGGRDADRTAPVAAVRDGAEACCKGGRGTAARAAGGAIRVPGIAAVAVQLRLGHADRAELRRVALAEDHEAGVANAADDGGIGDWYIVGVGA